MATVGRKIAQYYPVIIVLAVFGVTGGSRASTHARSCEGVQRAAKVNVLMADEAVTSISQMSKCSTTSALWLQLGCMQNKMAGAPHGSGSITTRLTL
ncbi:hypothetical protein ColTof4_14369 [Colletotrichum tofieldiae]|nr:hypothetical protein ColTof3_14779 [Colletotrichum tofieldiae]GKT81946.1 hypothetical protein ColTof4_14369 [Colletotrichum tofieldiae]